MSHIDAELLAKIDSVLLADEQANQLMTAPGTDVVDISEDGIALLFAENNPQFRWVQRWGRWMQWDGKVWAQEERLAVYDRTRSLVRTLAAGNDKQAKQLKRGATIAAIEKLARSDPALSASADQWDNDPFLLNTNGGIVKLLDGKRLAHEPQFYMTRIANCKPVRGCPRWMQFLQEVTKDNQELIAFLQRITGYALTGSIKEHSLFFFYGTGRNGKGVFLNTLVHMLGDYADVAPIEMFMESKSERHPTELAGLMGKRLIVGQEVDQGGRWAESKLKTLTGGDPISAHFMRQDYFTFEPQFKLFLAGNHKPAFRSIDEALRARLHLIPFTMTVPKEKRDPDLPEKLKDEWGGILQWAIDGALDYKRQGLNPPPVVKQATDQYFEAEDTFEQWIVDRCEIGPDYWGTPTELFNSWKQYAQAANFVVGDQKKLAQRLEAAGYPQQRTNQRKRHYVGIKALPLETCGYEVG